jgi:hypothetical protein
MDPAEIEDLRAMRTAGQLGQHIPLPRHLKKHLQPNQRMTTSKDHMKVIRSKPMDLGTLKSDQLHDYTKE